MLLSDTTNVMRKVKQFDVTVYKNAMHGLLMKSLIVYKLHFAITVLLQQISVVVYCVTPH